MALRSLNNPIASFIDYLAKTGTDASSPVPPSPPGTGLTATGGVISDYTDPGSGAIYRAHIFTSSGTFSVSALGTFGSNVEYLVVAGGGGGGNSHPAAGGGGGGTSGTGGLGGGGNAGSTGTTNTGGGGGGVPGPSSPGLNVSGGSGIVIIAYPS
jgi:hypothetical protein